MILTSILPRQTYWWFVSLQNKKNPELTKLIIAVRGFDGICCSDCCVSYIIEVFSYLCPF